MRRQIAAKAIIWNDQGQVLILRKAEQRPGFQWEVPGGRLDEADERLAVALQREVCEETGLQSITVGSIVGGDEWTPLIDGEKVHIVAVFITCHTKKANIILSKEHSDHAWMGADQLAQYDMAAPMRAAIERSARERLLQEGI